MQLSSMRQKIARCKLHECTENVLTEHIYRTRVYTNAAKQNFEGEHECLCSLDSNVNTNSQRT